jgi:hypothetical protein
MHKPRIYLDTSVVGGCFDDEFQQSSQKLVDEFLAKKKIMLISSVLISEVEKAPEAVLNLFKTLQSTEHEFLEMNDETEKLANHYLVEKILPPDCINDARHIAVASYYRADVLVSWNFKHIVNLRRIHLIHSVNIKYEYPALEIRNPKEVLEYDE